MTTEQDQLEAQSREAIKAWCDDPSVKLEYTAKEIVDWKQIENIACIRLNVYYYRIAKPKKWYRVAKLIEDRTITADNERDEASISHSHVFIEWLDERKYYD